MGRPKANAESKRERVIAGKVSEAEGKAWDQLRRKLGGDGPFLPQESEVLRWLIEKGCMEVGVPWPKDPKRTSGLPLPTVDHAPASEPKRRIRKAGGS
jgi:hypothetical protein